MKCLLLLITIALAFFALTGCSKVQDRARQVTDMICELPPAEREALRATVDAATAPHKIRVECYAQGN